MSICASPNQEATPVSHRFISFVIVAVLILQHLLVLSPTTAQAAVSTTVVISEFRVRGPLGGNDEFIELYNLTDTPINIGGWKINGSNNAATVGTRLTITAGTTIPARGHFLATNSTATTGYSGTVAGNQTFSTGVTDDGGMALLTGANVVIDQVGMSTGSAYKEGTILTSLGSSSSSNLDRCYERKPGSTDGNSQDTDNNLADFQLITPCNPQNLLSPPTPSTTPTPTPTATPTPTPTNPSAVGSANPNSVQTGNNTLLTVGVTPGTNPTSTGIAVTGDLSSIGGSASQAFSDDGTSGDSAANDNIFSYRATVPNGTSEGAKALPISVSDAQSRSASASISLNVTAPPPPVDHIAISQVYGGGGNTGSTLKNDYIELINRSPAAVNLNGWSVQAFVTPQGGTGSWQVTPLTNFTLQPGQYYLVQESQGAGGTDDLPTPDAIGTIAVSSTSSKVALVNNTIALTGTCPTNAGIADFVGYGTTAGCFEGSGPAPTLSNTTAALRLNEGCFDTNDNASDFEVGAPVPRNSSTGVHDCTGISGFGSANPSTVLQGQSTTLTVHVAGGQNPDSTGITVTGDLSSIGGSPTQNFAGSGSTFAFTGNVPADNPPGMKSLPITITDAQSRSFHTDIKLSVLPLIPDHIVISQIYGGGGNNGATYNNDYVELYNPTDATVTITGWTLQYASATGTGIWTNKQPLGGIIGSHQYYLVKLGAGTVAGPALPVDPNISGDINMGAGAGKIALVRNSDSLSGGCPIGVDADIVDFVGYGSTANCHEGDANAPAPGNAVALFRINGGGTDSDQNGTDFTAGTPNPRRTEPIAELGPWVAGTDPTTDGTVIPHDATVTVNFSEPVDVDPSWFNLSCSVSGSHNDATIGHTADFKAYAITPNVNFQFGEKCSISIVNTAVHDRDTDDSEPNTDTLIVDQSWSFTVVDAGQPAPYSPDIHLVMGNPSDATTSTSNVDNYLMQRSGNALSYNRSKGTPNWVSWHLDSAWYGTLTRVDTFRADPQVPADWYRVEGFDYAGTGFDRGHMTPNADRDNQFRTPINQETYLMSNMIPQAPDNNQGPWAAMEGDLRTISDTGKELFIVSGPLGIGGTGANGGLTETIANGHVTVPAYTWKVVLQLPHGVLDPSQVTAANATTFAVMMPNTNGIRPNPWQGYKVTVRQVEQATGLNFFSNVAPAIQNSIENGLDGANPPGTADQSVQDTEDNPVSFMLNATNPTNSTLTATTSQPAHGSVSCVNIDCTYTPVANFNGQDSFTFSVNNGSASSNTSTVTVTVAAVNDAPIANAQTISTDEDTAKSVVLTASDTETAAGSLVYTVTQGPTNGSLSGTAPNLSYTPAANYNGSDSFKFTVTDSGDGATPALTSSEATVTITVNPVNDPPTANNDSATVAEDSGANSIAVLGNDSSLPDVNETLTITGVTQGSGGSVAITNSGANVSYTPSANFNGTDSFTYTISDGNGGSATASVNVNVTAVNDVPAFASITPATQSLDYSDRIGPIAITVADVDNAAGSLVVTATGLPNGLVLTQTAGTGQWSISGNADVPAGNYTVQLKVADPLNAFATSSVAVTVGKEKASTAYTGDQDIMTAGPSISTATVRLGAHLTQEADNFPGDLTKATVRFELFKSGNLGTVPDMTVSNVAVDSNGDASATVSSLAADIYTVNVTLESANSYWKLSDFDIGVLNISVPTNEQRSNGGGWVADTASYNGRGHFGFAVTAGKNSSSAPKGNSTFFFRGQDGYNYVVKATSWQGGYLQFSAEPDTKIFNRSDFKGGCNVQKIDPLTGLVVESWGNFSFEIFSKDGDLLQPIAADAYSITVWDKNGAVWHQVGSSSSPVDLGGGNITNKSR